MKFKRWISALTVILFVFSSLFVSGCGSKDEKKPHAVKDAKVSEAAEGGLDLKALIALTQKLGDPQAIEAALNKEDSINNLHLNHDDQVDYIKVTEYGDGDVRGFSFTIEDGARHVTEIADLKFHKEGDKVNVQVSGNPAVYGQPVYYTTHWSLGDAILFTYLFRPHVYYVSPYYYGNYPSTYRVYRSVPVTQYRTRTTTYQTTTIDRFRSRWFRLVSLRPMPARLLRQSPPRRRWI